MFADLFLLYCSDSQHFTYFNIAQRFRVASTPLGSTDVCFFSINCNWSLSFDNNVSLTSGVRAGAAHAHLYAARWLVLIIRVSPFPMLSSPVVRDGAREHAGSRESSLIRSFPSGGYDPSSLQGEGAPTSLRRITSWLDINQPAGVVNVRVIN